MTKKLILFVLSIIILSSMLFSYPFRSWNHSLNPALFDYRSRFIIELGLSTDLGLNQNLFSFWNEFEKIREESVYVINIPELHTELDGNDFNLSLFNQTPAHLLLDLGIIRLGVYGNVDIDAKFSVPNDLFSLLAYGNVDGEGDVIDFEGTKNQKLNVDFEAGVYGSLRFNKISLGVKYGLKLPILVSDKDASYSYELLTSTSDEVKAKVEVNIPVYSTFHIDDLEYIDQEMILEQIDLAAHLLHVGFVYGEKRKTPNWGFAVNNINLRPALLLWEYVINKEFEFTSDNLLDDLMNSNQEENDQEIDEDFYYINPISKEYEYPLKASAFITIPFLLNWTPYVEAIFSENININYGVIAEGRLIFLPFYLGVENKNDIWHSSLGFRLNLHLAEIYAGIGLSNEDFFNQLDVNGLSLKINLAAGF